MALNSFKELIAKIKSKDSFYVMAHVSPDPDAIGSGVALALGLRSLGKDVSFHMPDYVSERLSQLVGEGCISLKLEDNRDVLVVDTANKERVNVVDPSYLEDAKSLTVIDHHISNTGWGDLNYVDAKAPASAIIVLDILTELGADISAHIANLLLAGLMDDTGSFRYSNTNVRSYEAASALFKFGAKPEFVSKELYFNVPDRVFKIRGLALNAISKELDDRLGCLVVTDKMLKECDATSDDTDGLIDEVRRIISIEVACMIRERKDAGDRKVSLRSKKSNIDVNKIAQAFGGGGHAAASGCTLVGDQESVKKRLFDEIAKHVS